MGLVRIDKGERLNVRRRENLRRALAEAGEPLRPAQVAADVRQVFALGFFRNVLFLRENTDAGVIVFTSFISPYRSDRDAVRALMDDGDFLEVHVEASVETCESRDVKGLYKKARAGEIPEFTGISAPYEAPERPELVVDTNRQSVEESVGALVGFLERKGFVSD